MPIYEYRAIEDNATIELIRPASQADAPVEDPQGLGRTFERVLSTFAPRGGQGPAPTTGGVCPCGDPNGPCNN